MDVIELERQRRTENGGTAARTTRPPLAPTSAAQAAASTTAPLLRVCGLAIGHGDTVIQQRLDFSLVAGEVLVVAGASGCGKSSLLRALIGLDTPMAGQVWHGDTDFHAADTATQSRLRQAFGVMFQGGALWSSMSVGENVMLPLRLFSALTLREAEAVARFKLATVGLGDAFDLAPSALSGGMKKRAAVARALALDPPLVFLDEPSAGLDPISSARLDALVMHLRDLGTGIVMVTHELDSIFAVADRLLFLDVRERTMTALGPPLELLANGPDAVRKFLRRGGSSRSPGVSASRGGGS
jgi:phospholipid/cholesterol/gamma-HCH transport system ATP-binding protein